MLNNASDYKFVDVSNIGSMIHGNIIPVTHPTAYNTAPLYFENYLFLLEAYNERRYVEQAGDNSVTPPTTELSAGAFTNLVPWGQYQDMPLTGYADSPQYRPYIYNTYGNWVGPNAYIENPTFWDYYPGSGYSDNFYYVAIQNWGLYCPTSKAPYYAMHPYWGSTKLNGEYIRAMMYAYNSMNKLVMRVRMSKTFNSATINYYNISGDIIQTSDAYLGSYGMSIISQYATAQNGATTWKRIEVVGDQKPLGTFPYATTAKFAVNARVYDIINYEYKSFWFTFNANINASTGAISFPSNVINYIMDKASDYSGVAVDKAEITWLDTYIIIDFEFPARLNGVNWNWQPQYT